VALGLGGGVGPLGPTAAVGLGGACARAALSAHGPALIAPLTLLVGRRAAGVAVAAGGGVSLVAGALVLAGAAVDRYTRGFVIAAGFAGAGALLVPAGRAAFGVGGQLACRNVLRNPRRSAATASALTIGVAVVATFMIVAASLKASIGAAVDETFRGQFVVQPRALGGGGLPTDLAAELSAVPGVVAAAGLRVAQGGIDGETVQVFGVDAERMLQIFDIGLVEGSAEVLDERSIAVHAATAARRGWRLGDEVTITWATIGPARLRISGLFERAEAGDYLVSHGALERAFAEQVDVQVYVRVADTAPAAQVRADIAAVVAARPNAELLDVSGFKRVQARQVDRLFQLVVALLLLAILIALLGIWNTLALSILERRREFGLLRALGMTPAQLRDAVRWESVIIALAGTVAGLVVGVGFGWSVMRTLADSGFHTVRAPFVQLAVAALVGALAGVAAAGLPARRAAAAPVAEALSVDSPGPA
ncbi:MAG: FtsX-like permease family protein, partial [Acidimicrobiales bacterium]